MEGLYCNNKVDSLMMDFLEDRLILTGYHPTSESTSKAGGRHEVIMFQRGEGEGLSVYAMN